MTRWIIGNLRTGRRILDLPVKSARWEDRLNTAETLEATVDLNDPDVIALGLRNSATPTQAFLAVIENDVVMAAGPIWGRNRDVDSNTLSLRARGLLSYFDHRLVLPTIAATIAVTQWTIPDPSDSTKTIANPALSSVYNGISLGTIAKRLVQQARAWTGGDLPVVFQGDESDTRTRTYLGVDFKPVGEALDQLTKVIDGPEINFLPRMTADGLGVEWVMQTGTVANPQIAGPAVVSWDFSVPQSAAYGLQIDEDASGVASLQWSTGGRQSDKVLVSRAYDARLVSANFPLLENIDSSRSTVDTQATLDGYAWQNLDLSQRFSEVWSFTTRAEMEPYVGSFNVGDFIDLTVKDDAYQPDGTYRHRIVGLAGDQDGSNVRVQCAPLQVMS